MRKSLIAVVLMAMFSTVALAQSKFNVSGTVIEKGTQDVVMSATVQVLSLPDSAFVTGAATSEVGAFELKGVKKGNYLLKVSYIGYMPRIVSLDLRKEKKRDVEVGYITLESDAIMLREATVTANAAKVQASGDSLIYNASAYRLPEGSALEELVKRLPGAEVDNDGNVKINGKEVKKVLVDGKEFFLDDPKMAMKNFNTDIIDRLKAYERKSDLARITGIDDGEEETVLDLSIKKGMKHGWLTQFQGAAGTKHRYNGRFSVQRYNDHSQFTVMGSANNTPSRWGWGSNGLNSSKEAGFNFATETDKLETGGSVRYRYNGSDSKSETSSQNFLNGGSFSESQSANRSSNMDVNANFRLEWKPDTMTNLIFRPRVGYSRNRGMSGSSSATFNSDPNDYSDNPLEEIEKQENEYNGGQATVEEQLDNILDIVVNRNYSNSQSFSENKNVNGMVQFNKRLSSNGRNITFRANGGLSDGESKQLSASEIKYYSTNSEGDTNNRYYNTPSKSHNYSLELTYSEPLADRIYLQFKYRFYYSYNQNDRAAYTYDSQAYQDLRNALFANRYDVDAILDYMAQTAYGQIYDDRLSQFSEYRNYDHTLSLQFRMVREAFNFNVGVDALPQKSKLNYKYMGHEYPEVERNVFNFTPTANFRYNFSKLSQLRFNYRGRTSQPSMTNLLEITDDSNPLNIRMGNSKLKPSFSSDFRLSFNTYNAEAQRGIFTHTWFNMTQNSVSDKTYYNAETGVSTTKPENINGNWGAGGGFGFNSAIGAAKLFTVNTFTNINYNNRVGYYTQRNFDVNDADVESIKSKTRELGVGQRLEFGYRNDWFEASVNGNVNYNHSRNNVMDNNDLDTWNFSYGGRVNIRAPWNMVFNSEISQQSRRGYAQSTMNTDELVWDASLSQSFLRGNALTISLEVFDILGERSNISRMISAISRTDSRHNAIYRYGMLRCIYKLNIFGGKVAGERQGEGDGKWGGGPGGRRGPGGPPPGRR